ncbi:MAG: peptidylprolyl isomerase [Polyangiaceae bacterium]
MQRVKLKRTAAALALLAALGAAPMVANAVIVEKVVAVVGDNAILLSDLQARGEPFLRQIVKALPEGPQRAAAQSQMNRDLLEKMIEEELETQAAERAKIVVSTDDLDKALQNIADQQGMSLATLFDLTERKTGMTETQYRAEIRRQIVEGKLLNLRVRGRIHITDEQLRSAYARSVREERETREYHPAWIVLQVPIGSSPEAKQERIDAAKQLVEFARNGEEFFDLAAKYSDDTNTKDQGGDLGLRAPQKTVAAQTGKRPFLSEAFEKAVFPLEVGDVTDPIDAGDGIVIIKLLSRQKSRYTTFEDARDEMVQRVQNELLQKEKDDMITEFKKRTHIERRL